MTTWEVVILVLVAFEVGFVLGVAYMICKIMKESNP